MVDFLKILLTETFPEGWKSQASHNNFSSEPHILLIFSSESSSFDYYVF